jgi:hypothetical protein
MTKFVAFGTTNAAGEFIKGPSKISTRRKEMLVQLLHNIGPSTAVLVVDWKFWHSCGEKFQRKHLGRWNVIVYSDRVNFNEDVLCYNNLKWVLEKYSTVVVAGDPPLLREFSFSEAVTIEK